MLSLHSQLRSVAGFMKVGIQIKTTKLYQALEKGLQALKAKKGQLFRRIFLDEQIKASVKIYENYLDLPKVVEALKTYKSITDVVQKDLDPMAQEKNLVQYIEKTMADLIESEKDINKKQLGRTAEEKSEEEDCFIKDVTRGGYDVSCGGKHVGHYTEFDDALKSVNDWQKKNNFFPNIWMVSDHGNELLIDNKGKEIKTAAEDNPDLDRVKDKFRDLAKAVAKATDHYVDEDDLFKWFDLDDLDWWRKNRKEGLKRLMTQDFDKEEVEKKFGVLENIVEKGRDAFQEWYQKNTAQVDSLLAAL